MSDFSAIDKDHCQAMKKMEKVKKLKKDGKSEEGEKRLVSITLFQQVFIGILSKIIV